MSLTQPQKDFLNILSAAFGGRPLTLGAQPEWMEIFRIAEDQHLLPLTFSQVREGHGGEQQEFFEHLKSLVISQVAVHIAARSDMCRIYRTMREKGLHPVALKGELCAQLYPRPDERITADLDLLVTDAEFDACHRLLCEAGLQPEFGEESLWRDYEVAYYSEDKKVCIELHHSLFDAKEELLNRPFADQAAHLSEYGDFLAPEPGAHLLFLILHAYKHFIYSGVGIRQVCDIGLWARAYGSRIDWNWVYECCDAADAAVFAASVLRLAQEYIGISFAVPEQWAAASRDPGPLLADMLDGGLYGSSSLTRLHTGTATIEAVRASRSGRKQTGLLRSLFPRASALREKYPYLKKYPVLLPAAWIQRAARYLGESKDQQHGPGDSARLAKQRLELLREYRIIP